MSHDEPPTIYGGALEDWFDRPADTRHNGHGGATMAYMIDTFDGHEWWPGAIDWQSREDAIAEAEKRSAKGEFVRVRKASNGAILWPEKHLEDTPCPL